MNVDNKSMSNAWDEMDATVTLAQATVPTQVNVVDATHVSADMMAIEGPDSSAAAETAPNAVSLNLSVEEAQLLDVLREVVEAYNSKAIDTAESDNNPPLELRVAGGWVRDKILGLKSSDIDIATTPLSGVATAQLVQEYLLQRQEDANDGKVLVSKKIGIINANIAQSKHLETATIRIYGTHDVDFCHLRTAEVYTEDSRIPDVAPGTPSQDAYRRDFTMNSLFFNIHSRKVEDWTQMGLADIREAKLRTPLPNPYTTLSDDPLRVLRGLRFAVRYRCTWETSLKEAASDPHIHALIVRKVSRERIGKELEGMATGAYARPLVASQELVCEFNNLAACVFLLPVDEKETDENSPYLPMRRGDIHLSCEEANVIRREAWQLSHKFLRSRLPIIWSAHDEYWKTCSSTATSVYDPRLLPLCVALASFRSWTMHDPPKPPTTKASEKQQQQPKDDESGTQYIEIMPQPLDDGTKSKKSSTVPEYVLRHAIKWPNQSVTQVGTIARNLDDMQKLLLFQQDWSRLDVGLLLCQLKELWVTCLLVAAATMPSLADTEIYSTDMARLYQFVVDNKLDECWKVKPLFNGKELQAQLQLPRGPAVGEYMQAQKRWMLKQAPDTTKDERTAKQACLEYLKNEQNRCYKRRSDEQGQTPSSVGKKPK